MALPAQLVNFTSPIVNKALETGARGSTKKTTNYGVIGDAMFKKAQLDLGIADLQARTNLDIARIQSGVSLESARIQGGLNMQQASLMSGLEMDKSRLNFDMAKHRIDTNVKLMDLKMQLREQEVGFFEGLFGTIAGAAQGAIAGSIIPGVGTVAGAIAGGAATGVGYAVEGRRGGEAAKQMLGNVATAASVIKQIGQEKKGQDAWGAWSERAQWLSNMISDPQTQPQHRMAAMQQLDQHMNTGMNVLTGELKMNPQAAAETMSSVRGVYMGQQKNAADRSQDFHMNTLQSAIEAKADPRFDSPTEARQALKEFIAKSHKNYAMAHAGKEMPNDLLDAMIVDAGIDRRKGVMDMAPTATAPTRRGAVETRPLEQAQRRSAEQIDPAGMAMESSSRLANPKKGRPINNPPPAYNPAHPKQEPGRAWHPPMVAGPGVQMDDGLPPAYAEQQLAKQGAEAAKILQDQEREELRQQGGVTGRAMDAVGLRGRVVDDKTQRGGKGIQDVGVREGGLIDKVRDLDRATTPEKVGEKLKEGARWVGDKVKKLDQAVTPSKISGELQRQYQNADPNAKAVADDFGPEPERGPPRDWKAEISQKEPEARPFFEKKDSRAIQKAYGADQKYLEKEDRDKVSGASAAAAQMNQLRDELEGLRDVKGLDRKTLHDYQIWKQGTYGEEGMKGTGVGGTAAGFGGSWQSFEKSVRQSLEGKGVKGKAADEVIQKLKSIDAKVGPLAQSLAVAKQGSRPSDADVKAYRNEIVNLMDPNPDNSIAGLVSLQELIYEDFRSFMNLVPSRSLQLSREAEESRMKRMSPGEVQARRGAQGRQKSYYEKLRDGEY